MKTIKNPWIKLKETIDQADYDLINKLQELCIHEDQTALKLELDYKLGITSEKDQNADSQNTNEFMYFDGQELIGYIGMDSFGGAGSPIEANGMVHPDYRRQGVFKTLSHLAISEWQRRNMGNILLLSDRKSDSGQSFIKTTGAQYKHTEYEMYLKKGLLEPLQGQSRDITLRKATNRDAYEVTRQNKIYFNSRPQDSENAFSHKGLDNGVKEREETIRDEDMILPEEVEKRGMTIYLAEKNQKIIGKVHLQLASGIGGIYGLGVLPEYRGQGFGRATLMMAVEKLKQEGAHEIMLQVAAENANALNLYKSCGFVETSTMDYYEIRA